MTAVVEAASIEELIRSGTERLRHASIEQPGLESSLLLGHVLGLSPAEIITRSAAGVGTDQAVRFSALVERRAAAEPFAYLVGWREFYGRRFLVDRRVLIPRPDSELVIEAALRITARLPARALVVDVGTGSGCLAVTLALEAPGAWVVAADISAEALGLAEQNAARHGLERRLDFVQGDLLTWLGARPDLIVANLPYVPSEAYEELPDDVRRFEPRLALDGGPAGTRLLFGLLEQAALSGFGALLAELDPRHARVVLNRAHRLFPGRPVDLLEDLAGRQRLLKIA